MCWLCFELWVGGDVDSMVWLLMKVEAVEFQRAERNSVPETFGSQAYKYTSSL